MHVSAGRQSLCTVGGTTTTFYGVGESTRYILQLWVDRVEGTGGNIAAINAAIDIGVDMGAVEATARQNVRCVGPPTSRDAPSVIVRLTRRGGASTLTTYHSGVVLMVASGSARAAAASAPAAGVAAAWCAVDFYFGGSLDLRFRRRHRGHIRPHPIVGQPLVRCRRKSELGRL